MPGTIIFYSKVIQKTSRNHCILSYPFALARFQNNTLPPAIQNNIKFAGHEKKWLALQRDRKQRRVASFQLCGSARIFKNPACPKAIGFYSKVIQKTSQNHCILSYPFALARLQNNTLPPAIQNNVKFAGRKQISLGGASMK